MKIHKLSPLLISKIAAGEVIERPSFALKELIENAIDAKATEIKIYIEESGLRKIQVIDNGEGMSEEDLQQSWKPHTTSKIKSEEELHVIQSLGFRGEALASLAAVSKLTIKSRSNNTVSRESLKNNSRINPLISPVKNSLKFKSQDSGKIASPVLEPVRNDELQSRVGYEIVVENGKLVSTSPVGIAPGTVVIAENLFANIPARKKFLKSSQTELRHIIDLVNHFAVSYPHIRFVLTHAKRTLFDYPRTTNISERIEQLVGSDTFSFFIPIKKSDSYVTLTGFVAKPQLHSSSQSKQYIFVNYRKVGDKLIAQAVKEAFGTMLESTTYPLFVLFINLPFEMVDVNVHPRKEQVSFANNQFMYQTIKSLVTEVLEENNLTFHNLSWKRQGVGMTKSYAGKLLKEAVLDKEAFAVDEKSTIFQLNKLYIVGSNNNGLMLVDQHAAHERILFEKLKEEFIQQKNKNRALKLPKPVSIHITKSEQILLEEHQKFLNDVGFVFVTPNKIISLKKEKISLTHLPALFQDRDPKELIKNILSNLETETGVKTIDTVSEEMIAFLACRAAVKAGDILKEDQMKKIISDLEVCPNNITCPHGRPTKIFFSLEELGNMFGR